MRTNKILAFLFLNSLAITTFVGNPTTAGDIVGRDLAVPKPANYAGHIGIWSGSQVVEVLDKPQVIQFNSLATFKKQSPYWGARGNKVFSNGKNITTLAQQQSGYSPTYTVVPMLTTIGGTKEECADRTWYGKCKSYKTVRINAKFRCDTFVDYMYTATGNKSLVEWASILPVLAYNRVEVTR